MPTNVPETADSGHQKRTTAVPPPAVITDWEQLTKENHDPR